MCNGIIIQRYTVGVKTVSRCVFPSITIKHYDVDVVQALGCNHLWYSTIPVGSVVVGCHHHITVGAHSHPREFRLNLVFKVSRVECDKVQYLVVHLTYHVPSNFSSVDVTGDAVEQTEAFRAIIVCVVSAQFITEVGEKGVSGVACCCVCTVRGDTV